MGLDMYAYVAQHAGEQDEYYSAEGSYVDGEWVVPGKAKPRELAYWRKHSSLHGWFRNEWNQLGHNGSFNGDELEVTWDMLDRLEKDVLDSRLPETSGFFFGDPADEYYREQDLAFIKNARAELFLGLKVFYNSSW